MVRVRHKGSFKNTKKYLKTARDYRAIELFHRYGRMGVALLERHTPIDTGETAKSWDYRIETGSVNSRLVFINTNVNDGVNIAILLQYGHATGTGGYVQGRDYINPAIRPIIDSLVESLGKEVANL